ncbi:MAG: aminotransferase class I/II-fold pyridoxal phosphate-dependent enzyme, partial [Ottowia sp.]|nr:aminotransferase class I/II-fold pyridoxal phosphate-dependent enzyme [Ottowia sp.]
YQGFGNGLAQDRAALDKLARAGVSFLVANSFSKNFSLYGERVGALSVVCANAEEAGRVLSQLKVTVRTNYSNPPTHGAAVVTHILRDPQLHALWEQELAGMRERVRTMRQKLVDGLVAAGARQDMGFMLRQLGMFSYSGLSTTQMHQLRSAHAVYGLDSGRLCVAALNEHNIDYVCNAIAQVL